MGKNAKEKDFEYLKQVSIASYQIFLGIAAVTAFTPLDSGKLFVIILNLAIALVLFLLGWKKFK